MWHGQLAHGACTRALAEGQSTGASSIFVGVAALGLESLRDVSDYRHHGRAASATDANASPATGCGGIGFVFSFPRNRAWSGILGHLGSFSQFHSRAVDDHQSGRLLARIEIGFVLPNAKNRAWSCIFGHCGTSPFNNYSLFKERHLLNSAQTKSPTTTNSRSWLRRVFINQYGMNREKVQ